MVYKLIIPLQRNELQKREMSDNTRHHLEQKMTLEIL
jgi:hypothetical protein